MLVTRGCEEPPHAPAWIMKEKKTLIFSQETDACCRGNALLRLLHDISPEWSMV